MKSIQKNKTQFKGSKLLKNILALFLIFLFYIGLYLILTARFGLIKYHEFIIPSILFSLLTFLFYLFSKNRIIWITMIFFLAFSWLFYNYIGLSGSLIPFEQEGDGVIEAILVSFIGLIIGFILGIFIQKLLKKRGGKNGF